MNFQETCGRQMSNLTMEMSVTMEVWRVLTLCGPVDLPAGRAPLRLDGRSRNRTRATTTHPIRTIGRVRSPPPPTDPLGPGTTKNNEFTEVTWYSMFQCIFTTPTTCNFKCNLQGEAAIHTFLGAFYVCAVWLRLPELKENYKKEEMSKSFFVQHCPHLEKDKMHINKMC